MLQIFMAAIQAGLCGLPTMVEGVLESELGQVIAAVEVVPMPSPKPAGLMRLESQERGTFSIVLTWQGQSCLIASGTFPQTKES